MLFHFSSDRNVTAFCGEFYVYANKMEQLSDASVNT
jgi:hypothetical protein